MKLSVDSRLVVILCIFFSCFETGNSSKILVLNAFSGKSHMNIFYPLLDGLHARGHDVKVYSAVVDKKNYPHITQIELTGCKEVMTTISNSMLNISEDMGFSFMVEFYKEMMINISTEFFEDPGIQQLIKEKPQYDLVIIDILFNDFIFPMSSYIFKAPTVYISTSVLLAGLAYDFNVPRPYSYVPDEFTSFSTKMSFTERMANCISALTSLYLQMVANSVSQEQVSRYLEGAPTIEEAKRNSDIILVNSDPVTDIPAPSLPNVINVGGIHCRPAKPLPKELDDWIKSSRDEGFIYFSLGSVMKGSLMPKEAKTAFLKAFSQIKINVLWKFEEAIEDLPSNVKLTKWAPQQDLLGHTKIRIFITHSGLLSTQEASYHGVPMIGLPVFADQHLNNAKVSERGFAEKLNIYSVTSEEIVTTINKILNDKRYKEAAKKYSIIMRDRDMQPVDSAIYWSEYVIRHKGAQHLTVAGKHLNIFQYFLIDVMLFVGIIALIAILVTIKVIMLSIKFMQKKLLKTKND